jgi:hypothetical protein
MVTTNGQVVGSTNVTFTNGIGFSTNAAGMTRTNLGLPLAALTNTNATNFRSAVGLGAGDTPSFSQVALTSQASSSTGWATITASGTFARLAVGTNTGTAAIPVWSGFVLTTWTMPELRTNLGIPLAALTNTSNVTMMRALSGSTNTNHPFSGTVSVVGTNNTNTLTFSNGILQSVQ